MNLVADSKDTSAPKSSGRRVARLCVPNRLASRCEHYQLMSEVTWISVTDAATRISVRISVRTAFADVVPRKPLNLLMGRLTIKQS